MPPSPLAAIMRAALFMVVFGLALVAAASWFSAITIVPADISSDAVAFIPSDAVFSLLVVGGILGGASSAVARLVCNSAINRR